MGAGVAWRGTAGECGVTSPSLERSLDGGSTWVTVTPDYLGIGQVLEVGSFAGDQAEIIAALTPDCDVQLLRTFTQGNFWAPYPNALAEQAYIDPADPSVIEHEGASIAAPCTDAHSLHRSDTALAIVCEGVAQIYSSQTWAAIPVPDVVTIASDSTSFWLGSISTTCDGLAITRVDQTGEPANEGCAGISDPSAPTALHASTDAITVWSGDEWINLRR